MVARSKLFTLNFSQIKSSLKVLKCTTPTFRGARRLSVSLKRLDASFPLSCDDLKNPSDELLEKLDAFRVRYSDLQDCIGNKLFRGVILLLEEEVGSMLDSLQKAEKMGLIENVDTWRYWRSIRNIFTHDYPDTEKERTEALNEAWKAAPQLIGILAKIQNFLDDSLELETV